MNVYDFDNTILKGDSTVRFFFFCLGRYPKMLLRMPGQIANGILFITRRRKLQAFKQNMLSFVDIFDDIDPVIEKFWDKNQSRVKPFYPRQQKADDVIISASPEFLIVPICRRLGIKHIMASPVDKRTGRFTGGNCKGEEKVKRFYERFPGAKIDEFYSDSLSDAPLARISEKAFMVTGENISPWPEK